jgi:hypothetical protein
LSVDPANKSSFRGKNGVQIMMEETLVRRRSKVSKNTIKEFIRSERYWDSEYNRLRILSLIDADCSAKSHIAGTLRDAFRQILDQVGYDIAFRDGDGKVSWSRSDRVLVKGI